jgi:hypothetical protein
LRDFHCLWCRDPLSIFAHSCDLGIHCGRGRELWMSTLLKDTGERRSVYQQWLSPNGRWACHFLYIWLFAKGREILKTAIFSMWRSVPPWSHSLIRFNPP